MTNSMQTHLPEEAKILGFPINGFGLFSSLLLSFALAFFTFFATTCLAIFALLAWNLSGHRQISYVVTYEYVGLPAFIVVLLVALPVFGTLWLRGKLQK